MTITNGKRGAFRPGMTLLELTVVILVLLALISILFIAANAWRRGADRAGCIMNIRNCQQAIRGSGNFYGISPGDNIPGGLTRADVMIGPGLYMANLPVCPSGSAYTGLDLTTYPLNGELVMICTFTGGTLHTPEGTADW